MGDNLKKSDEITNIKVGREIRRLREAKGRSLTEMAEAVGVTPPLISEIENGHKPASDKLLHNISKYLGVDENYLFGIADRTPYTILRALRQRKSIADLVDAVSRNLDDDEIDRIISIIFRIKKERGLITDDEVNALVAALDTMEVHLCPTCSNPRDRCT